MRDVIVLGLVLLLLPTCFRRPFIGLLLFSWLAYMRPQNLCWSFARHMRFSFYVAMTMLVGWYVNESRYRRFFKPEIRSYLLVALAVLISMSLAVAPVHGELTARYYVEFLKIILISLFTISQVDSKHRLRVLLWVICGSLSFYAVKNGLMGILSGGATIHRGPGGMLEDNNDFALALGLNVPLLFFLSRLETNKWVRSGCLVAIGLTAVTILLTGSRGGFLSLCAGLLVICWRSGKLMHAGMFVGLAVLAFFLFAPEAVKERLSTITAGEEDSSIRSRFISWGVAYRMWMANPFFGVGLRNYVVHAVDFGEELGSRNIIHVAHNSYLQIAAEGGGLAFITYITMLLSVFVSSRWLRKIAVQRSDLYWAGQYGRMFEAVLVTFMVGSTFLNRGHFDLIYHLIAVVGATVLVARAELRKTPQELAREVEVGSGVPAVGGPIEVRRRPVHPQGLPVWGR